MKCKRWFASCECILEEHENDRHECKCGGKWCATEDDVMSRFDPEWSRLPSLGFLLEEDFDE